MNASALRRRRAWRPARVAAIGAAALLTLTGCLQADLGVTLNDDESGEFRVRTLINREQVLQMQQMFGGMFSDFGEDFGEFDDLDDFGMTTEAPIDPCVEMLNDMDGDELPAGAVVEPINDGDWCGASVVIPFANLAEFADLAADFADESDDDMSNLGAPAIVKTADGYRFEVTGLSMSDDSMGLGDEGMEGMDGFGALFEGMFDDMRISYDVRLPGNPLDHNADAVDGNRFQWTLQWGDSRTELFAETGSGQPDGSADTGEITEPGDAGSSDDGSGDDGSGDSDSGTADGAAGGGSGSPTAPTGDSDDDGSSLLWLWIVLAVAVVGGVVGFLLVKKNKSGSGQPPAPGTPLPPPGQPSPGWQPPAEG